MSAVRERLEEQFGAAVLETHDFRGDETVIVDGAQLRAICRFLRDDRALGFDMLSDATAVDYLLDARRTAPRFEVVYHLYAMATKQRLRLKVQLAEESPGGPSGFTPLGGSGHVAAPGLEVDSLCELWPIANWLEREIWDMYGIRFRGHPELRRILLYEEFVGHPLRKDYPKEKRQPLVRRPDKEIAEVLAKRGRARPLVSAERK